jgi:hypothetical protein
MPRPSELSEARMPGPTDWSIMRRVVPRVPMQANNGMALPTRMAPNASDGSSEPLVARTPPRTTMGTDIGMHYCWILKINYI